MGLKNMKSTPIIRALKGFAGCTLIAASIISCGSKVDRLITVQENKKLVLGTSADSPPFEFHKTVGGEDQIVGSDIEIAKEIARDLGVELEIKDTSFGSLPEELRTGKIDIIMSSLDPTPEREQAMEFSVPYYRAEIGLIVRAADKDKYKTPGALKGMKVGFQIGSTLENVAQQIPEVKKGMLDKVNDLVLALESNRLEAVIVEKPVAVSYAANRKELAVAPVELKPASNGYVVGVPKGSVKLRDKVNKTIERLKQQGKLETFITQAVQLAEQ